MSGRVPDVGDGDLEEREECGVGGEDVCDGGVGGHAVDDAYGDVGVEGGGIDDGVGAALCHGGRT